MRPSLYNGSSVAAALLMVSTLFLCPPSPTQAAVVFQFNYTDAPDVGFNKNGQTGVDRRTGLENAASGIASYFNAYNAIINIDVNGSVTNDTTLASASSAFSLTRPANGFGTRGDVMSKILGFGDPGGNAADGVVNWNFEDFSWEPYSDFQPGELDLYSTAAHELLHALGFASGINQNGSGGWGDPVGAATAWDPFDQFVADSSGALIDPGTLVLDGTRWATASVGGTGPTDGLLFNGPNAMAANGGNPVPLYSPTTWRGGSSGSHLDTDFFTGANAMMMNHAAAVAEGLDIRILSAIEIGILRDIGYTQISAVPEPSTFALLACGAAYCALRRRRNSGELATAS